MAEAQAAKKPIKRVKPVLIADRIGAEAAAEVGRALSLPASDLYLCEPSIIELGRLVKSHQLGEDMFDRMPQILRAAVRDGQGKRVITEELLDAHDAAVFADLLHEASLLVASRVGEIFGLEEEAPEGDGEGKPSAPPSEPSSEGETTS